MEKEVSMLVCELAKKADVNEEDALKVLKALGIESSLTEAIATVGFDSLNVDSLKLGVRMGKSAVAV